VISDKEKENILYSDRVNKQREEYTSLEKILLNSFQNNFPLSSTPYTAIAEQLDINTGELIDTIIKLRAEGSISRIGPVFRPNSMDVSMLAAMSVPENRLDEVAALVNSYIEVNHNYEREHHYNLWFVLHGPDEDHIGTILDEIEQQTGLNILRLPILNDYHIDLGFDLQWDR
jgi:siroheme decarboxylase